MSQDQTHPISRSELTRPGPDRLRIAAAIGAAVNAGVFYSWSTMVMPALGQLDTTEAIAVMQVLNAAAPAPFMVVGVGTAALCVAVLVRARSAHAAAGRGWTFVGASLFIATAIVVTFAANVPLSASMDQLTPGDAASGDWADLYTGWLWANHLRTLGSALAAVALTVAALRQRQG